MFNHTLNSDLKLIHNESNNYFQIHIIALDDMKICEQDSVQYILLCSVLKIKKLVD